MYKNMGMRSNEMRPSDRVRSYKNSKPSLLQIIGIKRLVIILLAFVILFAGGYALIQWKDNKEIAEQQQAIEKAEKEDNYLNYLLSLLDSYYGFSYEGTINNVNLDFTNKTIVRQLGTLSSDFVVSGVCNSENITCNLSYVTEDSSDAQEFTYMVSNKEGVYYNVEQYCETSVVNYNMLENREDVYWSLMDHTYYVSYPAEKFYHTYSLYEYIRSVLELAKQDKSVELAKSRTDDGLAQYSAKIPSYLFKDENPLAPLFTRSESPVVCSIYSMGGDTGSRAFYIGFQQDDMTIQLTLTENTAYALMNPTYAVSEEHFLGVISNIQDQVMNKEAEKAKQEAEAEKKKKKKKKGSSEESSEANTEATSEVAE